MFFVPIRRSILAQKPHLADDLEEHLAFVSTKCGSVEARYLKDSVDFHAAYVETSQRVVVGDIFAALPELTGIRLSYAFLDGAYLCPPRYPRGHTRCGSKPVTSRP